MLSVKYIFLAVTDFYNITEEEIKDLEKLLNLCYLAVLLREVTILIELIVKPCVSKNQNEIFAMWVWLERKFWKRAEAMEKSIPELKMEFVCMCVREKNSF